MRAAVCQDNKNSPVHHVLDFTSSIMYFRREAAAVWSPRQRYPKQPTDDADDDEAANKGRELCVDQHVP